VGGLKASVGMTGGGRRGLVPDVTTAS